MSYKTNIFLTEAHILFCGKVVLIKTHKTLRRMINAPTNSIDFSV